MRKIIFVLGFCCITLTSFNLQVEPFKREISFSDSPTYEEVFRACEMLKLKYPRIVVAQSILETGHYTSKQCVKNNNLFGLYNSKNKGYYSYNHWILSVRAYKDKVQYKYKGGDYYKFLDSIGYAEDPHYISKVKHLKNKYTNDF